MDIMNGALRLLMRRFTGTYQIPGNLETDMYIIPVSGGADSATMAIMMTFMFPQVPFVYLFTDTGSEEPEIYQTLDTLEAYLARPITRIACEKSLYQLTEEWGGFLPSPKDRWCTRVLKLEPFQKWLEEHKGRQKHMFIGIRADESSRVAFTLDEVNTEMPFINMGVTSSDVFRLLRETIGIPKFYARRVRSGCSCCPFQRRLELTGLLQSNQSEFDRSANCEKVSVGDLARYTKAPSIKEDTNTNCLTLPTPGKNEGIKGRALRNKSTSLFEDRGVFIGAEFFFDGFLSQSEFIWHQRVVSYSTTLAGIKKQLDGRYKHLLRTPEALHFEDADEVRAKAKFAIYYVMAPADIFDPTAPKDKGYTWHKGESLRQLEHIISWATRILYRKGMVQVLGEYQTDNLCSFGYEYTQGIAESLDLVKDDKGEVLGATWYVAKEPPPPEEIDDEDLDERFIACPMCQL